MNKKLPLIRFFSLILVVALLQAGCGATQLNQGGALRTETHSVDADTAESVKVQIKMDLGELKIGSSSSNAMLMEAAGRL